MDEPFGAIDPITRERLQNEFLRLQAEIRKTIVFVTHDIDEALKMGDVVAVMREGGRLAQYAAPAELLMDPADAFVEQFVGSDRALKRLALQRVRDIDLWRPAYVRSGEPAAAARERLADADLDRPLLVDAEQRPLGWLRPADLHGDVVPERGSPNVTVEIDDVLRDALADLLMDESHYAAVVDKDGRAVGVLSIEVIGHALSAPVPDPTDPAVAG
jgi:osmoprotectant transport system ATP-binding protein